MEMEIVIIGDGKACGIGALWKRSMGVREKWRKKEKIRMRKKDDWVGVRMKISVITVWTPHFGLMRFPLHSELNFYLKN